MNRRSLLVLSLTAAAACAGDPMQPSTTTTVVTPTRNCAAGGALVLAVGDVRVLSGADRPTLCVSGAAAGDYVLVTSYSGARPIDTIALTVAGTNTTGISGVVAASLPVSSPIGVDGGARFVRNAAFDARLRESERALFASHAAGARATYDAAPRRVGSGVRLSVASAIPAVGDLISLNTNSKSDCSSPQVRTGRVVAITQRAVVVADTGNPTGGFTNADYTSLGEAFDTLAFPVDTANFGAPADIDNNGGRAVLFFTKAVNDLTPTSSQSYIGGFFYSRDLYPKTGSGACAGSNFGELFYLLVPDPSRAGTNANSPFTKASVKDLTVSVLAHEFQHLINASRRLYVTRTNTDEVVWLNEGLSHIAEELVFYRGGNVSSRHNIVADTLRAHPNAIAAFNQFQTPNFGRLLQYLPLAETASPFADNDSLETRGATWQLLRYAADRKGGNERDTWYALVNTSTSGLANLQNVFGAAAFGGTRPWVRDWNVANFTDDAVPTPAAYQHQSWNFRDVVAALGRSYSLKTRPLAAGTPQTIKLVGGGAGYVRFHVAQNVTALVTSATNSANLPTALEMTLVRTR